MVDTETSAAERLTQLNYKNSEYSDQSWEVIGEAPKAEIFAPLNFPIVGRKEKRTDPMFADYGGTIGESEEQRWHLPGGVISEKELKDGDDAAAEKNTISDEELEAIKAEAEERGRKKAAEEAAAAQKERSSKIEEGMKAIIVDLQKQLSERLADMEKKALRLSVAIAEKVINHAVEINPEYIAGVIEEAMKLAGSATIKKIRISAQDMEFIEVIGMSKVFKNYESDWEFEADPAVRAGCIVETSAGEIDFRLDEAFERIKSNVLKTIR